jgi:hypothetical protein
MKVPCEPLYADLAPEGGADLLAVRDLQARTAERRVEREVSWFRLAGFTMDSPPIDVVFGSSANGAVTTSDAGHRTPRVPVSLPAFSNAAPPPGHRPAVPG